jgi:hypothetical protein
MTDSGLTEGRVTKRTDTGLHVIKGRYAQIIHR